MPTDSKKQPKKVTPPRTWRHRIIDVFRFRGVRRSVADFRSRRPHRSFRLTRRRDYRRSLSLPGYLVFNNQVTGLLWRHRRIFVRLVIVYALLTGLLVGIASQDAYTSLTETIQGTGQEIFSGNLGELGKASVLFFATISGAFSETLTTQQQTIGGLIGLLTWLTTVWLLRNILAGHKVTLRDGIYSAGAPIVSTFIVLLIMTVQLLPLAIALLGYGAASASGILEGGVEAMLFWVAASLLAVLSLFWITSTFIALVVVTLPGMYPLRALSAAGDLVTGRRVRILLRLLWMILSIVVVWALVLIPIILLDSWVKSLFDQIASFPTVPLALLIVTSCSIVWGASYVYLLYRKVVDDDAQPA